MSLSDLFRGLQDLVILQKMWGTAAERRLVINSFHGARGHYEKKEGLEPIPTMLEKIRRLCPSDQVDKLSDEIHEPATKWECDAADILNISIHSICEMLESEGTDDTMIQAVTSMGKAMATKGKKDEVVRLGRVLSTHPSLGGLFSQQDID